MKKYLFLFIAVVAMVATSLSLTSCGDEVVVTYKSVYVCESASDNLQGTGRSAFASELSSISTTGQTVENVKAKVQALCEKYKENGTITSGTLKMYTAELGTTPPTDGSEPSSAWSLYWSYNFK